MTEADNFTDKQAQRLIQLYEAADREITAEINRGLLKGNNTFYLQVMRSNCRRILQDLRAGSLRWTQESIPAIYYEAAKEVDETLGFFVGFGGVHQQAVSVLADNAFQRLEDVNLVIGRQVDDVYRAMALENVRGTITGYTTWKKAAQLIRERLAERGVTGFIDRTGRAWNMRNYSEMVAITTSHEALRQGTFNRILEAGRDLAYIPRHENECKRCEAWLESHGNIISITGKTPSYPTYEDALAGGLFHPRCEHGVGAYVDLDAEIAQENAKQII